MVQFGGHEQATRVDSETGSIKSEPQGGSDTESIAGISEQGVAEVVDATPAGPGFCPEGHSVFREFCMFQGRVHQGSCDALSPVFPSWQSQVIDGIRLGRLTALASPTEA